MPCRSPRSAVGPLCLRRFASRPRRCRIAALEAGALAFVGVEGLKYAVGGRGRPPGWARPSSTPEARRNRFKSFPSRHTALMWAAVTPYAKEFGMPWLYGVAALTNAPALEAASIGSPTRWPARCWAMRSHAGLGGARESRREKNAPALALGPGTVGLAWELP